MQERIRRETQKKKKNSMPNDPTTPSTPDTKIYTLNLGKKRDEGGNRERQKNNDLDIPSARKERKKGKKEKSS